MRRAVFISHVPHEGPGLVGLVASEMGFEVTVVEAHLLHPLPEDLGREDVLVVMGGPMGVADIGSSRFPWLAPTVELLQQRMALGFPNLGICLGCQLMAHAAGAKVFQMRDSRGERVRELGWAPIRLVGNGNEITDGLPSKFEVLHWHGDACELPEGADLLASTEICPVQIFRLGLNVGLQFHPEVDAPTACVWAKEDAAFVKAAHGPNGVQRILESSPQNAANTEGVRRRLLRQIFTYLT